MSFSSEVKQELCRVPLSRKCCAQAECYGVLLYCNTFSPREIRVITESDPFAQRLPQLLRRAFRFSFDRLPDGEGKHIFAVEDPRKLSAVQQLLGGDDRAPALHINFGVLEEKCCRAAFLRGAFLAGGSVTDPRKGYHLELTTSHLSNSVVYFKQSDRIEDLLTSIGAPLSAMEVMNAKLEKDLRGSVNRRVNCDAANLDKAVEAAMTQVESIRRLEEQGRLALLPEKLQETASLRLAHPEDTLSQLAQRYDPPITKSALNHRLRKLVELAKAEAESPRR